LTAKQTPCIIYILLQANEAEGDEMQAPEKKQKKRRGYFLLPALKHLREEGGYSIRELADVAGVAPSTVWLLETLRTTAEPRTRRKLARALSVKITDLTKDLSGEEVDET